MASRPAMENLAHAAIGPPVSGFVVGMLIGPASGEEEHYRVGKPAVRTYVGMLGYGEREGERREWQGDSVVHAPSYFFIRRRRDGVVEGPPPTPRREFNLISWWCGFASRAPDDDEWFAVHAAGSGSNNKYAYAFSS